MSAVLVQAAVMHVACAVVGLVAFVTSGSSIAAVLVTLYTLGAAVVLVVADLRGLRVNRRITTLLALESMVLAGLCGAYRALRPPSRVMC